MMIMTSAEMSITSIEPSPFWGEKPKCRSIKSIGATLLRSNQSSTAPQTVMIEPKPISTPRATRSIGVLLMPNAETHNDHPQCCARQLLTIDLRGNSMSALGQ